MWGLIEMLNIRCEKTIWNDTIEVALLSEENLKGYSAQPLVMKELAEGDQINPFMSLKPSEAQQLMDELWRCGMRPSEGTGSAGALAATEKHLQDMKKIAFKTLKIDL